MIDLLSKLDLREFRAFSCRASAEPATGVIVKLPTNCTYEYNIVSLSFGGRTCAVKVVVAAEEVFGIGRNWGSRNGGGWPRPMSSTVLARSGGRRGGRSVAHRST